MPSYKLSYFNARARAEVIRYIFAYADVKYEDIRVQFQEWPEKKKSTPLGQLPVLEVDGKVLCQSYAIARYLAVQFGLQGNGKWEEAEADMYCWAIDDIFTAAAKVFFAKEDKAKAENQEEFKKKADSFLQGVNDALVKNKSNGFLVGKGLTYADLALFSVLEFAEALVSELLPKFPQVVALRKKIESMPRIAAWISKRPKTER